jgi:DNA-directed RNA polymerases I, II, and III subunit RPABC1
MSINQKKRLQTLIFKSRDTLLDMLRQRGYDVKSLLNYSYDTITLLLENHEQGKFQSDEKLSLLDIKLTHPKNNTTTIVKYRLDDKIKKSKPLKLLISSIYKEHELTEKDTLILLVINRILPKPNDKTNSIYTLTEEFRSQGKYIQVFGLENLVINISKHIFVPKHIILSDEEVNDLCNHYNIKTINLHKILHQDPMAKFIGLRPGQVVKTNTNNPITGISSTYKLCIA